MTKKIVMALACAFAASSVAAAPEVKINGFLTAGAALSDSEVAYLGTIDDKVSFQADSILGLQIMARLTDEMSVTGQLVAEEGDNQNFDVKADWAYLTYHFTDTLAGRAGKLRLPVFLVSDSLDVGFTYPWIRPPVEVYGQAPLSSYFGGDLLFNTEFGPFEFQLQPYGGNVREDAVMSGKTVDLEADNLLGINAVLTSEFGSLRVGYAKTDLTMVGTPVDEVDRTFASIGATLDWNNLIGYVEYAEADADTPFVPNTSGWYVTAGYRFDRLLPHLTLASAKAEEDGARKQDSIALGLNYTLNNNAVLKLEYQQVDAEKSVGGTPMPPTTYGYFAGDPDGEVGVFSVAIDVVF